MNVGKSFKLTFVFYKYFSYKRNKIMKNFENVYLKLISEMNENIDNKSSRIIPTGLTTEKDYEIMKSIMRTVV